jgi:hypothetical protein
MAVSAMSVLKIQPTVNKVRFTEFRNVSDRIPEQDFLSSGYRAQLAVACRSDSHI